MQSGNTQIIQNFDLLVGQSGQVVVSATITNAAQPGDVISNITSLESPDASIHYSTVSAVSIMLGELPSTGQSPYTALHWVIFGAGIAILLAAGWVLRRKQPTV